MYLYYRTQCEISIPRYRKDQEQPGRLLWPAYAFDDACMFNVLTKSMVMNLPDDGKAQTASARYGIPEEIESHLPDDLLGEFPEKAFKYVQLNICKRNHLPR